MSEKAKKLVWGFAIPIAVMAMWGILYPMTKVLYKYSGVDTSFYPNIMVYLGIRFTLSGGILTAIAAARKELKHIPVGLVALMIVFGILIQHGCMGLTIVLTGSANTTLIKQLGCIIFAPFMFLFFKDDKFSLGKVLAAVIAIIAIFVYNLGSGNGFTFDLSTILLFVVAISVTAYSIVSKHASKHASALALTAMYTFVGGIALLVLGFAFGGKLPAFYELGVGTGPALTGFLPFVVIVSLTCISYLLWQKCLGIGQISGLTIIKQMETIFSALFSALIAGEAGIVFTLPFLIATVLNIAAMAVSNVDFSKKKAKE